MELITYRMAVDFLLPRHYSGRVPNIKYAFGAFNNGELVAVCTFGKPASHHLCIGVCGVGLKDHVMELNRLCVDGDIGVPLSKFVGWCLRELKKHNLIVVSYADSQMNHNGYIYQALNFLYTGATAKRTEQYSVGGKHSRHSTLQERSSGIRKVRSSKHRYVYFAADKRHKKIFINALKYKVSEYPKGENKPYDLGDYLKPTLLYKGETITEIEAESINAATEIDGVEK